MSIAGGILSLDPQPAVASFSSERDFDRLTKLAVRVVGATSGLLTLLDDEGELNALCLEVIRTRNPMLIEDVAEHLTFGTNDTILEARDPRVRRHPADRPRRPGARRALRHGRRAAYLDG